MRRNSVVYWTKGHPQENFGDALSTLLLDLGGENAVVPAARYHLLGSVLDDNNIREELSYIGPDESLVFWGCGVRGYHGISPEFRERIKILGVRGPLSKTILELPEDTPLGDPALLLPYIYEPKPSDLGSVTLCVTHALHDYDREALQKACGADVVLSAKLPSGRSALELMIDRIAGASFVLAGSLHAAIVACAYGRPFAYFDGGYIDCPVKWDDFAQLVQIPSCFVGSISEAKEAARKCPIIPAIPPLGPLLSSFPFYIDPHLIKAFAPRVRSIDGVFSQRGGGDGKFQVTTPPELDAHESQKLRQYEARISRLQETTSRLSSQKAELNNELKSIQIRALEEKTALQQRIIALQQQASEFHLMMNKRLEESKDEGLRRLEEHQRQGEAQLTALTQKLSEEEVSKRHFSLRENELQVQVASLQERVDAIRASTSWKITSPLRFLRRGARWFAHGSVAWLTFRRGARPRRIARRIMQSAIRCILSIKPRSNAAISSQSCTKPDIDSRLTAAESLVVPKTTSLEFPPTKAFSSNKKVGLLAPVSASGAIGGAERFYAGLAKALQAEGYFVELLFVTIDESSFEGIKAGYDYFARLDLSNFDLVISTKAPSYAAIHSNHLLYLVHTIRVFYDMFDETFSQKGHELESQRAWVIAQDNAAFARIQHRFSIGGEVSRRMAAWNGSDAEILHPPLALDGFYNSGVGDYFFMPGRLHKWKRVDLAIRAIKISKLPMKLCISGIGEAEDQLRDLAGADPRIVFLGQVDDESLKRLFAGALAVPFLAVREDYGYVTLEAFASSKAVVTCLDSGEATFFVKNGVTGLTIEPSAEAISNAFETLWSNRELAAHLGRTARESIAHMTWSAVARRLIKTAFPNELALEPPSQAPLKVAILDMQPIMPAVGGGRLRLLGLYHNLGPDITARYVGTYDWPGEEYRRHHVSATLEEINVPLSAEHHEAAAEAAGRVGGKTVIDLMFAEQARLSPDYLNEALAAVDWADVVIFSHPWVAPLISDESLLGKTVVYDSHNVEIELRRKLLDSSNSFARSVIEKVAAAEKTAGDRADIIFACSSEDAETFASFYGWKNNVYVVPNGVFSEAIKPATRDVRNSARTSLNLPLEGFIGFFIGSDYQPNAEAALFIVKNLAPHLPDVTFVIVGGVCRSLPAELPKNVYSVGFVEDADKVNYLQACDFAINPMFSGSGTNIKMFDFMSAGLPVITTPVGARGITKQSTAGLRLAEREELVAAVRQLKADYHELNNGGRLNRSEIEAHYAWEKISPNLGFLLRNQHLKNRGRHLLNSMDTASCQRVAHLSTVGLRCGIGEYTRKVIEVYHQHGIANLILTARSALEEPNLEGVNCPASVAWFYDNLKWKDTEIFQQAFQSLEDFGATHVIVQYHFGFFSPQILFDFVVGVMERGATASVVVHNFSDDCAPVMRQLNQLGVNLFSHRMTEVIQARVVGVRLDRVPMGIDRGPRLKNKNITRRDFQKEPPLIITTGFLREHKGASVLINAMPQVIEHFPSVRLKIQCALYPSQDSREELEHCEKEIRRLGIQPNVILDTRFLDKKDLHAQLAKADVAVLPYRSSNEGGSATAADCIAAGLPLIVSDAEIFDELREVTLTVSPNPNDIANAILRVLLDEEFYNSLSDRSCSFATTNAWENIVGAFLVSDTGSCKGMKNGPEPTVRRTDYRSNEARTGR